MSFRVGQHNLGRMVKARNNSRQQCTPEKTKIQLSHPFRVFSDVSSNLPASCASLLTELPAKATAGCTLWRQHSKQRCGLGVELEPQFSELQRCAVDPVGDLHHPNKRSSPFLKEKVYSRIIKVRKDIEDPVQLSSSSPTIRCKGSA